VALERMRVALLRAFDELQAKNDELTAHATLLEQHVAERTEALLRANAELLGALEALKSTQSGLIEAEKLASLGRLVAGVAHELNTPLGNALTVVTTLEDLLAGLEGRVAGNTLRRSDLQAHVEAAREGQDILLRNVTRAADLVRGFKQLAIDQTTDMRRSFSLVEVVNEILITVRPSFNRTRFRIETNLLDAVMDSYPGPLGQVLTNLVLNALAHAFIGREEGCVTIDTFLPEDGRVCLVCRDDGVGMAPEVLQRIFEPFYTTRFGQGGSGLGLHIARNIVVGLLGGAIDVRSAPGQGAEFRMVIPLVAPARVAA
jgi:two-component system, NtrC family, sensor kinase